MRLGIRRDALEPGLFALLVLACLLPIWMVCYLPTTDGPAHLYRLVAERGRGQLWESRWTRTGAAAARGNHTSPE